MTSLEQWEAALEGELASPEAYQYATTVFVSLVFQVLFVCSGNVVQYRILSVEHH